nr:nucleic acid binding protein [Helenium virus S]
MDKRNKANVVLSLCSMFVSRGNCIPIPIVFNIYMRAFPKLVGRGTSTYAKRRRARSILRCERCYRVYPPLPFSKKCDNRTCVPGISHNIKVADFIKWGVTEVIPHPGFNF